MRLTITETQGKYIIRLQQCRLLIWRNLQLLEAPTLEAAMLVIAEMVAHSKDAAGCRMPRQSRRRWVRRMADLMR